MSDRWWIACQIVVVLAVIAGVPFFGTLVGWPLERPTPASVAIGAALIGLAGVTAAAAVRALGRNFDPRPTPIAGGALVIHGPFRRVRHPIYAAVLLGALGYAAIWPTPQALTLVIGAAVFFSAKARHEEELLRRAYPGYSAYAGEVRHRLIPGVL